MSDVQDKKEELLKSIEFWRQKYDANEVVVREQARRIDALLKLALKRCPNCGYSATRI